METGDEGLGWALASVDRDGRRASRGTRAGARGLDGGKGPGGGEGRDSSARWWAKVGEGERKAGLCDADYRRRAGYTLG